MLARFFIITLLSAMAGQGALARSLDNLGHCSSNAQMVSAAGSYKGNATAAIANPEFLSIHTAHTQDQPDWLAKLSGGSGRNRLYVKGRHHVLVVTVCDPTSCERVRGYVGFDLISKVWSARLYLDGQTQELGMTIREGSETQVIHQDVAAALICAQNLDWETKK